MNPPATTSDATELASNFTVAHYRRAAACKDRSVIAEALRRRFAERYIFPVSESRVKHGFATMAICCLMIESIETFRQGWESSRGHEGEAFERFFTREPAFAAFVGHEKHFYENVRCGILHQGETYRGWKVVRRGALFDKTTRTINAALFLRKMRRVLDDFCDELKVAEWKSGQWERVNKKMRALCTNCKP
jgi:hypothetical protein